MKAKTLAGSNGIAKERLMLLLEADDASTSPAIVERMKHEISEIVSRYFENSQDYEIKVLLKQEKKRA